jgi:hypothetical protein
VHHRSRVASTVIIEPGRPFLAEDVRAVVTVVGDGGVIVVEDVLVVGGWDRECTRILTALQC